MSISANCKSIIHLLGEDTSREGLIGTPHRFEKSMQHLCKGYSESVEGVINGAIFSTGSSSIIAVSGIEFYSLCEHHILPFFGKCSIRYKPNGKVLGLSKFARVVDVFARRLQIQEQLTYQIHSALCEVLSTEDVEVTTTAQHLCMMMRGVEKQCSSTTCTEQSGIFIK